MKRVLLTTVGIVAALAIAVLAQPFFSDVPDDHPHAASIIYTADKGWFFGYDDGTFRPDQAITPTQMAAVLARVFPDGLTRGEFATFLTDRHNNIIDTTDTTIPMGETPRPGDDTNPTTTTGEPDDTDEPEATTTTDPERDIRSWVYFEGQGADAGKYRGYRLRSTIDSEQPPQGGSHLWLKCGIADDSFNEHFIRSEWWITDRDRRGETTVDYWFTDRTNTEEQWEAINMSVTPSDGFLDVLTRTTATWLYIDIDTKQGFETIEFVLAGLSEVLDELACL